MITRPLDLESRLSPPPRDLNFVAWVNVGLIVLFFALLGSRFVLATGVPVGTDALVTGVPGTNVIVNYRGPNMVVFNDGIYNMAELRKQMKRYIQEHPGSVVLLSIDGQAPVQAFVDLSNLTKELGYGGLVLSAESKNPETPAGR
jgi:biopolymer transport protein ExbD